MRFDKQSGTVLNRKITTAKHGRCHSGFQSAARIVPLAEGDVWEHRHMGFIHFLFNFFQINIACPIRQVFVHATINFQPIRQNILIIGAIRYMTIHRKIGKPFIKQLQPCLHFGSIGFHKITVKIQVLSRNPPAHFLGTILINTIIRAKTFVPVHIKNGDKKDGNMIEQLFIFFGNGNIPEQHQTRIFSIGFTGMYASLNEQNGIPGNFDRFRIKISLFINNKKWQIPALGTLTKYCVFNPR